jgi:hypothetical protein
MMPPSRSPSSTSIAVGGKTTRHGKRLPTRRQIQYNNAGRQRKRHIVARFLQKWKEIARKIGDFQARLLLSLFYFVILSPFALVLRLSADPLAIKPGSPRGWRKKTDPAGAALDQASRQF